MQVQDSFPRRFLAITAISIAAAACADGKSVAEPDASAGHDHPGIGAAVSANISVPGGVSVQPMGRGSFIDNINVLFRVKLSSGPTTVVNVADPSDVLVARITVQPGGSFGWHTHHGPVIVTVVSGELGIINASDCVQRNYPTGKAFVDPGQGNVHVGFNASSSELVVVGTFLDVPIGQGATIPADPACGF
ncbi:MAG: cupin domain-containing protein [Gemmatimonadaceae bacterium]